MSKNLKILQTNNMKKSSFVFGATVLAISGVLCKVLGAVYKVPLANMLKTEGIGIYYLVFPIYSLFLTLSSSCFPTVISRFVANAKAENKHKLANKIFVASLIILVVLGFVLGFIMLIFSNKIASAQGIENGAICYVVLSPAILFVAIISAFRGYFQGLQNMIPTAVSQIIEQIVKFVVGIFLSVTLIKYGVIFAVLGAMLGVVVSELFSLIYLLIYFVFTKKKNTKKQTIYNEYETIFSLIKKILKTTIPFFLNSILFPLFAVFDNFLVVKFLEKAGYEFSLASSILGINTGIVNTIINLPVVVAVSIAMAIIPSISFSYNRGDVVSIENKVSVAIKFVFLISIPCVFMFMFFSREIVSLLFSGSIVTGYEFAVATNLLSFCSITVLYQSLLQIFVAVLQAIKKAYAPTVIVFVSLIVKTVLEILLLLNSRFNVLAMGVSSFVCFFIATLCCYIVLKKHIKIELSFTKATLFPCLFSVFMLIIVKGGLIILYKFIPAKISILLSFFIGGVLYLSLLYLFKIVDKKELFLAKNNE